MHINTQPVADTTAIFFALADGLTRFAHRADEIDWSSTEAPVVWFTEVAPGPWRSWHASKSSEAPVAAGTVVEVRLAGDDPGNTYTDNAECFRWSADPEGLADVIAYRVLSPATSSSSTTGSTGSASAGRPRRSSPRGRRATAGRAAAPRRTHVQQLACYCWAH